MDWKTGRPIYDRLPGAEEGYRIDESAPDYNPEECPPVARWITTPWDELLVELREKLDGFPVTALDPLTADEVNLDWLAQFAGFTGRYWSASWPTEVKRVLIANAYGFIWPNKGTRRLLEFLFTIFELDAAIFVQGEFRAGINSPGDTVGGGALNYWITASLDYLRTSAEWQQLQQFDALFGAAYAESAVVYDRWYAGFSAPGDPVF